MNDLIDITFLSPPHRRRNRGHMRVVVRSGGLLIACLRRISFYRKDVRRKCSPAPCLTPVHDLPCTRSPMRQDLEQEILRLVWERKTTGIFAHELRKILSDRYETHTIANALRDLGSEGRVESVRVVTPQDPWPPMRIFMPEYSPTKNARNLYCKQPTIG